MTPPAMAVGVLGEPSLGEVDASGALWVPRRGLRVRWRVHGGDRWAAPEVEVSRRQRRVGAAPVVETSMRIGGGDARWTVYGAETTWGPAVLLRAANDGHVPFAVGVTVDGPAGPRSLDGAALQVGGRVAVIGPRPPSAAFAGDPLEAAAAAPEPGAQSGSARNDALDEEAGRGLGGRLGPIRRRFGASEPSTTLGAQGSVTVVWPLPHRSTLTLVAPLSDSAGEGDQGRRTSGGLLPDPDQVARGWARQLGAVSWVDLPDETLAAGVDAQRAELLLRAGSGRDPRDAVSLTRWGHHDEAAAVLARASEDVDRGADPAPLLEALADHVRLTGDASLARASVETVAFALDRIDPAGPATAAAATLLRAAGEDEAAGRVGGDTPRRRRWGRRRASVESTSIRSGVAADSGLASSGVSVESTSNRSEVAADSGLASSGVSAESTSNRSEVAADDVRRLLVDDSSDATVTLLPGWRPEWAGRPIEVHGLPTAAGRLSFALRWHGPRPALLWEIEAHPPGGSRRGERSGSSPERRDTLRPPELTAPALDSRWKGRGERGEALLGEPGASSGRG